jgi:enoyl-CoA hydratase/carnithine racemase
MSLSGSDRDEPKKARAGQKFNRVDRDPSVHAVVFTGTHPERFISHADVRWLQEGAPRALRSADAAPPP